MKSETKRILGFIAFGVVLFSVTMHFNIVLGFLRHIVGLIFPILLGLLLAFVLNVPMSAIERRLRKLAGKRRINANFLRPLSLLLTFGCILLVITLAVTMAVPALVDSVRSIRPLLAEKVPLWLAWLESYEIDLSLFTEWLASLDYSKLTDQAGNLLGSAMEVASTTISGVTSTAFGFIIAIYVLLSKQTLALHAQKLTYAHLDRPTADWLCHVGILARDTYTRFLSGQCVEAMLLGLLIFIAFTLFRLPYAGLVAFLTGLFAFVPYIGALLACFVGAFLALLVSPVKLLVAVAVHLVVQFIENQFIYPHVVGTSVGLSPLWTLIAALIGGKLFGLLGIIFFIPLVAVLYTLVREDTNRRLARRGITFPESSAQ